MNKNYSCDTIYIIIRIAGENMSDIILLMFEILGTIAFAASGAMTALSKKMDIFGVAVLALVTAVGGGVMRDVVLGQTPPATFSSPVYALVSIAVAVIIFIPAVRRFLLKNQRIYDLVMLIMDSIGLGVFTVVGVETAFVSDNSNPILLIFVGMVTGIGGGILRDVLSGSTPFIFVKHFYASASLIGAVVCIVMWRHTPAVVSMTVGAVVVVVLRLLAAHFHWSLPKSEDIDFMSRKG